MIRLERLRALVALVAVTVIGLSIWRLEAQQAGLSVRADAVDGIPVTVYALPQTDTARPVVLVAHGFAGSQTLMAPYAVSLARAGFLAVTFDYPGHGRNPRPLPGDLEDLDLLEAALLDTMEAVSRYARALDGAGPGFAVLGHSMGADAVVTFARDRQVVDAVVAVSGFLTDATAEGPPNLLSIYGGLEPEALQIRGLEAVRQVAPDDVAVQPGEVYGAIADGTARSTVVADGVEHIGVLYDPAALGAAVDWLVRVFETPALQAADTPVDRRGPWLLALLLATAALAWPLSHRLPRLEAVGLGAGLPWRRLWPIPVVPAVATPVILWPVPTGLLPLMLGDYLTLHFLLYGLLTAAALAWWGRDRLPTAAVLQMCGTRVVLGAMAATTLFATVALGVPVDRYFTTLAPIADRVPLILALLIGTLPYFLADEWVTRGDGAARGAYPATKALFLLSLGIAIALNLNELFFLLILLPVILLLFTVYGLFSRWIGRRTGLPLVMAVANAVVFAWAIAVVFPTVDR